MTLFYSSVSESVFNIFHNILVWEPAYGIQEQVALYPVGEVESVIIGIKLPDLI